MCFKYIMLELKIKLVEEFIKFLMLVLDKQASVSKMNLTGLYDLFGFLYGLPFSIGFHFAV